MASMIRSRRIAVAAGALSIALVAPLTPAAPNTILPVAVAQNTVNDPTAATFTGKFETTWDENRGVAVVQGIELPTDIVLRPDYRDGIGSTKAEDRWNVSNEDGRVVLIPPTNIGKDGSKEGTYKMPIRVIMPQNGIRFNNPRVSDVVNGEKAAEAFNVRDTEFSFHVNRTPQWVRDITGLDVRHEVDFSQNATQTLENVRIPVNAETYTITNGWTTRNDNGRLQIIPPNTYGGGDADIQVKVRVPDQADPQKSWSETITVKLNGLGKAPANNLGNSILGLLGGGEGAAAGAGGILGAALPLILGALGVGGGGGASAGFLPGLNSLVSININVPDAKIDIHGNYVTDSGNPNVEVKDNTATATVDVRDNGRDNNAFVEANANVTDNVKGDIKALESLGGGGGSSSKTSKDSKTSKVSTGGSKVAATGNSRLKEPTCIASLAGFGLPMAALIPVLLANVFRVPGFEGIQDAMKAAAASMPAEFNVSEHQVAAGVGGFAGALAIAGLAGIVTQCVPAKDEVPTAPAAATATETATVPAS